LRHKREHWILLDQLTDIILENVKGCVVDIGIGQSTAVLYDHTSKLKRKHYCCDISGKRCRWARTLPGLEVFEGRSFDFIKQFSDIPVALVFLDGDHKYSTVIEEIKFFLNILSPGGIIFFHDTMLRNWGDVYGKVVSDSYLARQEMEQMKSLKEGIETQLESPPEYPKPYLKKDVIESIKK
jgi:predicted O-methyltransferase YrrM